MHKSVLAVAVAALTTLAGPGANAAGFSLGGRVGLPGVGIEAAAKFSNHFGARASFTGLGYSFDFTYDDVDYDVESSVAIGSLLLDVYPMGGMFRITAGGAYYNGQYDISATPSAGFSYEIGNGTYNAAAIGTLNGAIEYKKAVPYLGVGWDFMARKQAGFGVTVDAGLYFIGKPDDVTLTASGGGVSANDLALERSNIEDDTASYDLAIGVGLYYRF